MLDTVLRLMTTGGVFVGATAVYAALHNHSRQLNAQIFLAYSDRLQTIRRVMRTDLLPTRAAELSDDELAQVVPGTLEVLHLVLELRELRTQRYVKNRMWTVWARDIDRLLDAPVVRVMRDEIRQEFGGHRDFLDWMEHRQRLSARDREPSAARQRLTPVRRPRAQEANEAAQR